MKLIIYILYIFLTFFYDIPISKWTVLSMTHVFAIGLAVQKHFTRGLTLGSVKG